MNLNKVFILGRLTVDPQLRSTASGQQVASFGVATNRVWNDKSGQRQEAVEFHNVVVWGRQAEVASQYLTKGSLVLVEGRLQTRDWEGKDGQKRRTTEIIGERIQLGPKPFGKSVKENPAPDSSVPTVNLDEGEIKSEDLPF
ncbi:MAG: single-stranded DNA-binding protein [Candidatus Harrisonbacteria bacterium]|nr:single-stranded DNA-binding protein [Candidatus Harrisonbacteria bacterium]